MLVTGQWLYEQYVDAMEVLNVSLEADWVDLPDLERVAWNYIAAATQKVYESAKST